jgi:hypothetical protein
MNKDMNKELLTIQEAAAFFGVSTRTLLRWEEKGYLVAAKTTNNERMYNKAQLDILLRSFSMKEQNTFAKNEPVAAAGFQMPKQRKNRIYPVMIGAFVVLLLVEGFILARGFAPGWSGDMQSQDGTDAQVLAAEDRTPSFALRINVPAIFGKKATFLDAFEIKNSLRVDKESNLFGGINTNNNDINAGTGRLTASNVLYSLLAGTNVTITGDPQNPTISATGGVDSIQGQTGAISFAEGSGISLDGLTIANAGVLSVGGQTGEVSLSGGSGISVSGTTITNTDAGSAQNIFKNIIVGSTTITAGANSDSLTFEAGSGISISSDTSSKKITITGAAATPPGWTDSGSLVSLSTTTDNVTLGSSSEFAKLGLIGDTDEIQMLIRGNGTQTNNLFVAEDSAGTDLFRITATGQIVSGSSLIGLTTATGYLDADAISFISADGAGGNSSASGLETDTDRLGLLQGCANGQVLKWNDTSALWECSNDSGGATAVINVESNELAVGANVDTIDFSTDFVVAASPSNEANVSIADDILNFTELADALTLDAATGISFGDFNFTLGTNAGTGGLIVAPNAGGNSALIVNKQGSGDIFSASASGTTRFTITNTGDLQFSGNTGFMNILTSAATANRTYTLPDASGTICLSTGNCAGAGSAITGSGTVSQLAFFSGGTQNIASDSNLFWDNAAKLLGIGNATPVARLDVAGAVSGKALAIFNETGNQEIFTASASGTTAFTISRNGNLSLSSTTANSDRLVFAPQSGGVGTFTGTVTTEDLTGNQTYTFPNATGTVCLTSGNCAGIGGNGDITAVGSMASGDAFADGTADDDWLGLGASAGRIEFDDQAFDEVNVLAAKLGIGTQTPDALLHATGAVPGKALAIFDETGDQNILTASASGTTRLTLDRSGNLNIIGGAYQIGGTSVLNATTLGSAVVNSSLQTLGTISSGTWQASAIGAAYGGTGDDTSVVTGVPYISSGNWLYESALDETRGGTGLSAYVAGDLLYGSGVNTLSRLAAGGEGTLLSIQSGTPTWISSSSVNYWQRTLGALAPLNITDDLLLGGSATASARFAFLNVAGGTPTASMSAGASGGTYLTAAGLLQTTANQSLILGGNTTGNIVLNGDALNNVGIGTSTPQAMLHVAGQAWIGDQTFVGDAGTASPNNVLRFDNTYDNAGNRTANKLVLYDDGGWKAGLGISTQKFDFFSGGDFGFITGHGSEALMGTERLTILSGGNVGIGTTSPTALLDVAGAASVSGQLSFRTGAGAIQTTANNTLTLGGNTTGNILLNSDGNDRVGIGTSAPTAMLDVNGTLALTGTGRRIMADFTNGTIANRTLFQSSTTNGATSIGIIPNGTSTSALNSVFNSSDPDNASYLSMRTTSTRNTITSGANGSAGALPLTFEMGFDGEIARFDTNGRFGIGTDTTDNRLVVAGTIQDMAKLYRNSTTDNDEVRLNFAVSSDANFEAGYIAGVRRPSDSGGLDLAFGANAGGVTPSEFMRLTGTGRFGIGSTNPLARLDVRGNSGTIPIASFSGQTSHAGLIVDNNGVGDLFTASTSGATRFTLSNAGTGTFAGNVAVGNGMNLNGGTDSSITFQNNTVNILTSNSSANVARIQSTNSSYTGNALVFQDNGGRNHAIFGGRGNALTLGRIAASGAVSQGTLTFSDGTLDGFGNTLQSATLTDNRTLTLPDASGTLCLQGSASCGFAAGTNYWQSASSGVISPYNDTVDLLVGGTATSSAKFAFMNVADGTPTASISGASNNATSLTATGILGTTNAQTLQLGGAGTGDVILAPAGTERLRLNSTTMTLTGTTALNASSLTSLTTASTLSLSSTTTLGLGGNGTINGGSAANGDITIKGTSNATRTSSYVLLQPDGGSVGIGNVAQNSAPDATLDVRGFSGTVPIASFSGQTSHAGLMVDNNGLGDLFTASKSGATKFTILNNGNVRINNLANCNTIDTDANGVLSCGTDEGGSASTLQGAYDGDADGSDSIIALSANDDSLIFRNPASSGTDSSFLLNLDQLSTGAKDALVINSAGADANFGLRVNDDGTSSDSTPFVIDNTGNVGIGVTAPSEKLQINGNILIANGGSILGNGSSNINLGNTNGGELSIGGDGTNSQVLADTNNLILGTTRTSAGNDDIIFQGTNSGGTSTWMTIKGGSSLGKVGIGTTTPDAQLDIRGQIGTQPIASFSGQTSHAGLIVDNSGVGDIFTASSSGLNRFVIKQNGNVGIGTTTPQTLLDITSQTSNGLRMYSPDRTRYIGFAYDGANVALRAGGSQTDVVLYNTYIDGNLSGAATAIDFTEFDVSGSTGAITINDGGDLGNISIEGTILDINSLDFAGVGSITTTGSQNLTLAAGTGYVRIGDTATPGFGNGDDDLFVEGDIELDGSIYTALTAGSVVFSGTNGVLTQDNANFFFDDTNNRLGIGTTTPTAALDVAGAASVSGSLSFRTGAGAIQTTANNTLTLGGNTTGNIVLNSDGNDNVGIGTATPTGKLYVNGGAAAGFISMFGADDFQFDGGTNGTFFFNNTFGAGGKTFIGQNTTDFTVVNGGSVGIGTSTPTANLDVAGAASVSGSLSFRTGAGAIQTTANNTLTLGGTTTGNILLNSDGNDRVGIGTTTPTETLDVAGAIKASTGSTVDSQGFESATFVPLSPGTWSTGDNDAGNNNNWTRETTNCLTPQEGSACARSGAPGTMGNDDSSFLDVNYTFAKDGVIKFYWKISSEDRYDFLMFCVDNDTCSLSTGGAVRVIHGEVGWVEVIHPVRAGAHSFRWLYAKDSGTDEGTDAAWIDNVRFVEGQGTVYADAFVDANHLNGRTASVSSSMTIGDFTSHELMPYGTLHLFGTGNNGGNASIFFGDHENVFVKEDSSSDTDILALGGSSGIIFEVDDAGGDVMVLEDTGDLILGVNEDVDTSVFSGNSFVINDGALCVDDGTDTCDNAARTDGAIYAQNGTLQGIDLAETYPSKDNTLEPGDVVVVDPEHGEYVKRSEDSYQGSVVGIVSTDPGILLGGYGIQESRFGDDPKYPIALAGRIPTKVSTENGPIKPGDPLTSSSIPGVAMKAKKPGQVIAKALESYDNADPTAVGKIVALVNISWYDPRVSFTEDGNLAMEGQAFGEGLLPDMQTVMGPTSPNNTPQSVDTFDPVVFNDRVATSSALANANMQVSGLNSMLNSLTERVNVLESLASSSASMPAAPGGFTASSAAELDLDTLDVNDVTVADTLAVLGRTTLSDVGITGRLNIGLLSIEGLDDEGAAAINTSAGPLKLQSTGFNGIDILDGKMTIDTSGNLKTDGEITAKKVNIDTVDVASASLGEAVLEAGLTKVVVTTTALTEKSKVFVQAQDVPLTTAVKKIAENKFEIRVRGTESTDVKLNWWIVN